MPPNLGLFLFFTILGTALIIGVYRWTFPKLKTVRLPRKIYNTRREKVADLLIGLGGWVALNGILWGANTLLFNWLNTTSGSLSELTSLFLLVGNCLPLVINVGLIVFFAYTRSWIALGMLLVFGLLAMLMIVAAIFVAVNCFISTIFGSSL